MLADQGVTALPLDSAVTMLFLPIAAASASAFHFLQSVTNRGRLKRIPSVWENVEEVVVLTTRRDHTYELAWP